LNNAGVTVSRNSFEFFEGTVEWDPGPAVEAQERTEARGSSLPLAFDPDDGASSQYDLQGY
jgi:hypothetical protein